MHDEPEDRDDVTEPDLPKIKGQSKEDRKLLTQALSRFKLVANAEDTQRKLELDDLKFFDGDQWPQDVLQQRAGLATTAGAPAPARPCLTINKVKQPVRQVTNAQRQARLAIQVNPKSGGASQRTAEVLQGLIRHIEVESNAIAARSWAYHHAVTMGRGYYRILKQYSNDGDFDLDLVIKRIRDQFSVYLDPFAEEPDASDMEWAFVTTRIPLSRYKLQYPKSKLARMQSEEAFTALGDQAPGWMGGEGASRFVRVAEHWYVEHEKRTRILTANNHEGWLDDYEAAPPEIKQQMGAIVAQREVDERKVRFCKITALEVLDREEWEGRYIPIIQVIGDESYVNGKRGFKGIVRDGKDPNRAYNFMRSSEVEAVGLAPKAPWVIAFGQLEGFEKIWATANTYPHSYLPYHGKMEGSHLLPPPQRNMGEPAIQAIAQSVREADADIKATTGIGDPSLGLYAPSDRSGKAIETLKRQAEHGTSHYLENLASISMTYEGKVLLDLIPKVYDRPGRITRILSEDDEESMVALNQGYVPGPDGPIVVPDSDKPLPPEAILHTLNQGHYTVTVSVGRSFQTQRQESVEMIGEVFKANPAAVPIIFDLWLEQQDWKGAKALAARVKKALPPGLADGPESAANAQAKLAQAEQGMAMMQQQMQQMAMTIETKQIEHQAKLQIEREKLASEERIALAKLQMEEQIALRKLEASIAETGIKAQADQQKTGMQIAAQSAQTEAKLQTERAEADNQRRHERGTLAMQTAASASQQMRSDATKLNLADKQAQSKAQQQKVQK
jgi:hypothetical protein